MGTQASSHFPAQGRSTSMCDADGDRLDLKGPHGTHGTSPMDRGEVPESAGTAGEINTLGPGF